MHHGVEFLLSFDFDIPEPLDPFLGLMTMVAVVVIFICLFANSEGEHVQWEKLEGGSGFCVIRHGWEERVFGAGFLVLFGIESSEGSFDCRALGKT